MRPHAPVPAQRGAVLVVALIFLVILGLIGLSVAQNTTLDERMAGNTRNRDLAFQAAEAALKDAERHVADYATGAHVWDGTEAGLKPYVATDANDSPYWKTYAWANAAYPASVSGITANNQPRYIVQKLPDKLTTQYFRATALGLSGDDSVYNPTQSQNKAVVILQAIYCYDATTGGCT